METRKKATVHRKPRAVTSEILGSASEPPKIKAKWREHYARLLELRAALEQRRAESVKDALSEQPAFSTHMADAATDTYDRDLALGMLSSEQDALYQVDQALDRIQSDRYGICELTGKPIEPERLAAVPWTRFSAAAEKQLERDGNRKRARLGPRETVGRQSAAKESEETE